MAVLRRRPRCWENEGVVRKKRGLHSFLLPFPPFFPHLHQSMMPPGWTVGGDYKPPRFSEQEIDRFKERQQIAKASPLRKSTLLPFSLPSLYPESVYDSTMSFPQSPNPLRQASQSLLNLLSGTSPRPLALKLTKGIVKGAGAWSQVWRAEIDVEGRRRKVVVKLYAESLFPIPVHPIDGEWQSGDELCKREADA